MTLVSKLNLDLSFENLKTVAGVVSDISPRFATAKTNQDGTGLDQGDLLWSEKGTTIADATTRSLDLSGGLTNGFGDTLTFVKVKGVYVRNATTTAGAILQIGASVNAFLLFKAAGDVYKLGPDGIFFVWEPSLAGLPVTASTGDILDLNNSSGEEITYDIAIWGTSA